jgi:dihydroorotate dehydrogenase
MDRARCLAQRKSVWNTGLGPDAAGRHQRSALPRRNCADRVRGNNDASPEFPALIGLFDRLARPLLRALDPEDAHALALGALAVTAPLQRPAADDAHLAIDAFGLRFANPLGIAAGFDKNAQVPDAILRLGFGFAEVGTVTPRPQAGNPRPRIVRLDADQAVINRLGFNNDGFDRVRARLLARRTRDGIVGVNIGANKDAKSRTDDYVAGIAAFAALASFFTINVSSPNTPGLRDLQGRDALLAPDRRKPVLLKIAPDLALADLDDVVAVARNRGIDGMIVANTTLGRPTTLRDRAKAKEAGGLSGRPLFPLATRMLAETFVRVEQAFPLIGVGGIDSGAAAFAKIKAGASLVQIYSGFVFRGVGLIGAIKQDLVDLLRLARHDRLAEAVGRDAAARTAEPWPT